ncbi:MAG: hypothetical protein OXI77_17965 [Chloroflexota bacterium]|nr:hypothetical protein [Chloroflexota bacterium]MDE2908272.1 hypothetical protein [Chloroflexota bacterium]
MWRFSQVGIALGALGGMICFMGLFPGVTGAMPTVGIGLVQVVMVLFGYTLLILGALTYLKFTFFLDVSANLVQNIGTRLALTGVLFATLAGMADILGFGTHIRDDTSELYFGQLQMIGILASFGLSSFGVLVYVLAGASIAKLAPVEALSDSIAGVDDTREIQLPETEETP